MDPDFENADKFEKRLNSIKDSWKAIGTAGVAAMTLIGKELRDMTREVGQLNEQLQANIEINLGAAEEGIDRATQAMDIARATFVDFNQAMQIMSQVSGQPGVTSQTLLPISMAAANLAGIANIDPSRAGGIVAAGVQATGLTADEYVRSGLAIAQQDAPDLLAAVNRRAASLQASGFDPVQFLNLVQSARTETGQDYSAIMSEMDAFLRRASAPSYLQHGTDALRAAAAQGDLGAYLDAATAMTEDQQRKVFGRAATFIESLQGISGDSLSIQQAQLAEMERMVKVLERLEATRSEEQLREEQQFRDANTAEAFSGPLAGFNRWRAGFTRDNPAASQAWDLGGPALANLGGSALSTAAILGGGWWQGRQTRNAMRAAQAAAPAAARSAGRQALGPALATAARNQVLRGGARGIAARGLGRMIPGLGWGLLALDAAQILGATAEGQGWVDEGVIPRWLGGSGGGAGGPSVQETNIQNNFAVTINAGGDAASIIPQLEAWYQETLNDANNSVQSDVES